MPWASPRRAGRTLNAGALRSEATSATECRHALKPLAETGPSEVDEEDLHGLVEQLPRQ